MKESLRTSIESLVDGLKIDGKIEAAEVIAVLKKVGEVALVASSSAKLDGKVELSEVSGVLRAVIATAPKEFWQAVFEAAKEEIKESKTKVDDIFIPALALLEKIMTK
jgi:Ca2+-binding EF-hand superfamily protein